MFNNHKKDNKVEYLSLNNTTTKTKKYKQLTENCQDNFIKILYKPKLAKENIMQCMKLCI